jgi:hypothetical protein
MAIKWQMTVKYQYQAARYERATVGYVFDPGEIRARPEAFSLTKMQH